MTYKTAKEWGLPSWYPSNECFSCGHKIYSNREKCFGFQEIDPDKDDRTVYQRFLPLCSVCLQVQLTINKDSLHKNPAPNCWKPIKRMFLCDLDMKRIAVWQVLDHKPWLKKIQELPSKGESEK